MSSNPILRVRPTQERRILMGHPWAYSNELFPMDPVPEPGSIVTAVTAADVVLGQGFYNPNSLITFRLVARSPNETINADFLRSRIRKSIARRGRLLRERNAVRLVNGEADFLPGLVVDLYNDIVAFQTTCVGMELFKTEIAAILQELCKVKTVVEKNRSHLRKLENLPLRADVLFGTETTTEITDAAGTRYHIDVLYGQKTGFFLDQMENRTRLRYYVEPGMKVLDLFTNAGGFGINAALAGAGSVTALDESKVALEFAQRNVLLNNVGDIVTLQEANVFEFLKAAEQKEAYDIIILDPPALAKSKKDIQMARKAYTVLNGLSMRLLKRDGLLLTCSCSYHINHGFFLQTISSGAQKCSRKATIIEDRGAGIDHPILSAMPDNAYLKSVFVRVH